MRHLILAEGAPAIPFRLTDEEARWLANAELANVTRSPGDTLWEVAAGRKVGVVRVGELQVTIRPKVPIPRLVFLMGYALEPAFWRDQSVVLDREDGLPEALAESFRRQATRALEQGLLHGYKTVEETLPVLRGRIRVGDQVRRRQGMALPLEVVYDDFTVDIAENQLLLAATHKLLRIPALPVSVRRGLHRLKLQLADVTPLVRGMPLPRWNPSRLNTRYQPALRIAALVLAGDSFEQRAGDLVVSGFVLDMWKIYEDFVCRALQESMRAFGGSSSLQMRTQLDADRVVAMRPDFVWSSHGSPKVVADAKYKAEKPSGFPQADLYQLLAYCTVLGIRDGHLIYARGEEDPARHEVQGSSIRIVCHALDLQDEPGGLLVQIDHLASLMIRAVASPNDGAAPAST